MLDIIIKGGRIVDGAGAPAYVADIAILDGRIVEIGAVDRETREVIDAEGAIVTRGFIDIHTHHDGQFLWDQDLEPSFSNGVTTAIGGNCGVGFAPARARDRRTLIDIMEGVEDIPGIVLDEGLDWSWDSFPDYLDRLAARSFTMDVAAHIPHAPLRLYVMGERAARHEAASPADLSQMKQLVLEAMEAGPSAFRRPASLCIRRAAVRMCLERSRQKASWRRWRRRWAKAGGGCSRWFRWARLAIWPAPRTHGKSGSRSMNGSSASRGRHPGARSPISSTR